MFSNEEHLDLIYMLENIMQKKNKQNKKNKILINDYTYSLWYYQNARLYMEVSIELCNILLLLCTFWFYSLKALRWYSHDS